MQIHAKELLNVARKNGMGTQADALQKELSSFIAGLGPSDKARLDLTFRGIEMTLSPAIVTWVRKFESRARDLAFDSIQIPMIKPSAADLEALRRIANPANLTDKAKGVLQAFLLRTA